VNKHLGTTTCVGGPTVAQCPDVHFRPIGTLMLKGKEKGLETFEPVAPGAWESPRIREYLQAFQQLRAGAGDGGAGPGEAARAFAELLARYPDDKLAALHAGRLRAGETGVVIVLKEK
jgi:adenylate cyclase